MGGGVENGERYRGEGREGGGGREAGIGHQERILQLPLRFYTHTHAHTYSDELDHEALKHTPTAAASLCCTTERERDQPLLPSLTLTLSLSVCLILFHTIYKHTHTVRHVLQGRSECWVAEHSGPPSPSSSFSLSLSHSLSLFTLSVPAVWFIVASEPKRASEKHAGGEHSQICPHRQTS